MTIRRTLLAAALASCCTAASAQAWFPADGIWQIEGANGSGLTLDVRDHAIGIGLYTYDDAGNSVWYSGAGSLVDGTLAADITRFSRGSDDVPTGAETLSITIEFQANAAGTLAIGDGEPHAIRSYAFGADYVGDLALRSAAGVIESVPDMRGRWLFAPTGPERGQTHDLTFLHMARAGEAVQFWTALNGTDTPENGDYLFTCAPDQFDEAARGNCILSRLGDTEELARFDAADMSATRVAGTPETSIGFRVPEYWNRPQSGIWQIVGRFGEGVTIDVRPDLVAIGVFAYDEDGAATWSIANGQNIADAVEADLLTFADGSCIDCEHVEPTLATTRPMRIEFLGATRARLTIGDDAPLALSLLPFGADYLAKPLAEDPFAEEFGPHLLPALSGAWAQTSVQGSLQDGRRYRANTFVFGEAQTVDFDDGAYDTIRVAPTESWDPPDPLGFSTYPPTLACDATPTAGGAACELATLGGGGSPPAPPMSFGLISPRNITSTRSSGINGENQFPGELYMFRIPPRPADD